MTIVYKNAVPSANTGNGGSGDNPQYTAPTIASENPRLCGNVLARLTRRMLAATYGEDAVAALPAEAIYVAQAMALRTLAAVAKLPVGPFLFTTNDGGVRAMLDVAGPVGLAVTAQCYAPTAMPAGCQRLGTPASCRQYAYDHLAATLSHGDRSTLTALAEDLRHVASEIAERHATLMQTATMADNAAPVPSVVWAPWCAIAAQLEGR